jgi:UDP-glucose 4-epimerase
MARSQTVLVTGATGFVMANLVGHLARDGHAVVAADRQPPDAELTRFLGGLAGTVTFRQVDVSDGAAVRALVREVRPARAVHGAALTSIPTEAERARFAETVDVNVGGTLNVLAALAEVGTGRIVAISSGSVYGSRADLSPVAEDDVKDPRALYPVTKWAADMLARRFAEIEGLDLAVARLASPFGPLERDTGSRPLLSPLAYWTAAAVKGEPIVVTGGPSAPRDAVYVEDVAGGISAILFADRVPHDAYNVGWGRTTSTEETLAALRRLLPALEIERRPEEPSPWAGAGNTARGPLRIERLTKDLGWHPRHDLRSGLAEYVAWLKARV